MAAPPRIPTLHSVVLARRTLVRPHHGFSPPLRKTHAMTTKYVYYFGGGKADGSADMKDLLGGKGANLAEMANLGLPVPAGFTIVTDYCNVYLQQGRKFGDDLKQQVGEAMRKVEQIMGLRYGD